MCGHNLKFTCDAVSWMITCGLPEAGFLPADLYLLDVNSYLWTAASWFFYVEFVPVLPWAECLPVDFLPASWIFTYGFVPVVPRAGCLPVDCHELKFYLWTSTYGFVPMLSWAGFTCWLVWAKFLHMNLHLYYWEQNVYLPLDCHGLDFTFGFFPGCWELDLYMCRREMDVFLGCRELDFYLCCRELDFYLGCRELDLYLCCRELDFYLGCRELDFYLGCRELDLYLGCR